MPELVEYQGSGYAAKGFVDVNTPPTTGDEFDPWTLIVRKGDDGAQGPAGADGAQGAKGDTGDQGIQGVQGNPGLQGAKGDAGKINADVATTAALPACTYANGAAGVGATLIANANGALPNIDGVAPAVGTRVLVKDEANAVTNGVYFVTSLGDAGHGWILTRAADADSAAEIAGQRVTVVNGAVNGITEWLCVNATWNVVGADAIRFTRTSPTYSWGQRGWPWVPNGLVAPGIAENFPRAMASAATAPGIGPICYAVGNIVVPAGKPVNAVNHYIFNAPTGVTIWWVGLMRAIDRVVLGASVDGSGGSFVAGMKSTPFAAPIVLDSDTPVYALMAFAASSAGTWVCSVVPNASLAGRAPSTGGPTTVPTSVPPAPGTVLAAPGVITFQPYVWLT